jgi:hypothetical protein
MTKYSGYSFSKKLQRFVFFLKKSDFDVCDQKFKECMKMKKLEDFDIFIEKS